MKLLHSTLGLLPNACHPACPLPPAHPFLFEKITLNRMKEKAGKRGKKEEGVFQHIHATEFHLLPQQRCLHMIYSKPVTDWTFSKKSSQLNTDTCDRGVFEYEK